jgi:hypothetical protein
LRIRILTGNEGPSQSEKTGAKRKRIREERRGNTDAERGKIFDVFGHS